MKKIIYSLLVLVALLTNYNIGFSKNNDIVKRVIKGTVIDKATQQPVPYATVAVEGLTLGAVTNFNGEFEIKNVPLGTYNIVARCIGYKLSKLSLILKESNNNTLNFKISEDFIGLEQVVVTADRNNVQRRDAPVVVNSIPTKLLEHTAAATLADGLAFSPGLRVENDCNNCGFSQVRMNGLEGPYTQILINSRPIFSGLAGVYGLEHIPANMIQRVEVVRGGGSALFGGNAIAGTINIITKDPVSNSFKVGAKYGIIGVGAKNAGDVASDINVDFNASVVTDNHKSGIFIFGMNRNRDEWDANDDNFSDLVQLKNVSAGFRAYHRFSDLSKLTAEYHIVDEKRRGGDQLDLPAHEALVAEEVSHRINSGGLVFDHFFNADRNTKMSIYASGQKINRHSYYGAAKLEDDKGVKLATPIPDNSAYGKTDDLAMAIGAQLFVKSNNFIVAPADITLGVENTYNTLDDNKLGYYNYESKKFVPTTKIADQTSNTIGLFAQSKWDFDWIQFLVGARFDSYKIKNSVDGADYSNTVISPRANILFNLSDDMQLRMSYARGFRAPQIFDEDLHIEASSARRVIHKLAANLKEETSNSYTLSWDYTKNIGKWQTYLLAEGFYTRLNDPFFNDFSDIDKDGNMVMLRKNANGAVVKGVNMELKIAPSHFVDFQAGMTVQSSKYDDAIDQGEDSDVASTTTKEILRTPKTYGYFALNWKPLHEFTTTISGNYTGPMHLIHLSGGLNKSGDEIAESLVKSDSFMDMSINFAYHFDLGREVKLQFDFGVKNIFNAFQDDFDYGPGRDAGYIYGPLNPRTIYLGIKLGNLL